MVFPVVMYGCEIWIIKKAEGQRIYVFELWCWRRPLSLLVGDWTSPSYRRSVLGVHWKDWCWSWDSKTLATSCEKLTHWKRPWCWEGLGAQGEGDDRGWDSWMASLTWWTWIWVNSRSWWWTGRPGVLQFMGSQSRTGLSDRTELNWTEPLCLVVSYRTVKGQFRKKTKIPWRWGRRMLGLSWRQWVPSWVIIKSYDNICYKTNSNISLWDSTWEWGVVGVEERLGIYILAKKPVQIVYLPHGERWSTFG